MGQRADIETAARKMNAFVRTQDTADDDPAFDLVLADLQRFELDFAVAEQDRIAFLNHAAEAWQTYGYSEFGAENLSGREHEGPARL